MTVRILQGDVRERLAEMPSDSFDCGVTSPPYWGLRDYGVAGQIGLEPTLAEYLDTMIAVCRELRRVLKPSGTFWLNVGDSYSTHAAGKVANPMAKSTLAGVKTQEVANASSRAQGLYYKCKAIPEKNLLMVPNRLAIRLQEDGWFVRSEIIWHKPNPMPESVTDRPTSAHEKIWLLTKSERYFYDADAIRETSITGDPRRPYTSEGAKALDGRDEWRSGEKRDSGDFTRRNARNVWTIATQPYSEAHFATFPPELAERCIKAGCPASGHVLDPFGGAGTTGMVADRLGRHATLIELNPAYVEIARERFRADAGMFAEMELA